eukprot:1186528-Prorocentrum_minimum.AAC.4
MSFPPAPTWRQNTEIPEELGSLTWEGTVALTAAGSMALRGTGWGRSCAEAMESEGCRTIAAQHRCSKKGSQRQQWTVSRQREEWMVG